MQTTITRTTPNWIKRAQSLSLAAEIRQEEANVMEMDSEIHEDIEDDTKFSSLFVVHDKQQCEDRTQKGLDWKKFTEERNSSANTITGSDLPEDHKPKFEPKDTGNQMRKLSTTFLRHLAICDDKRAQRILDVRDLPKKLGVEMIINKGGILANGTLKIESGWAGTEEAEYYRKSLGLSI
jgi:hypothetical protein